MTRVVITGAGIVSPIGVGTSEYWRRFVSGASGIRTTDRFRYPGSNASISAAIVDDDLSALLPCKQSAWNAARATTFALAATKLAIEDAGLNLGTLDMQNVGIAFGTTLSCLSLMSSFDREAISRGPRRSDPCVFPDTGFSAPACRISVLLGPCAFNVTLSNGETAVLDAMGYACSFLRSGRAHTVLVGGSEEVSTESVFGFARADRLKNGDGRGERTCNGEREPILGEGAGVVVVEDLAHAQARSARILAEVVGCSSTCGPQRLRHPGAGLEPACAAVRNALQEGDAQPQDIDFVCHGANGLQAVDAIETRMLNRVFGYRKPHRTNPSPQVGGGYSVAGAMKIVTAALALQAGVVPSAKGARVETLDASPPFSPQMRPVSAGMVTGLAASGANAAVVLRAWEREVA